MYVLLYLYVLYIQNSTSTSNLNMRVSIIIQDFTTIPKIYIYILSSITVEKIRSEDKLKRFIPLRGLNKGIFVFFFFVCLLHK